MAYIYALIDPRTNEVRYIGKASDIAVRLRRHKTEKGNTHKCYWLRQLREQGYVPQLQVLEEVEDSNWAEREIWWIKYYRDNGANLTNHCSGGNGAPGISPSDETRQKLSQSLKAHWEKNPPTISEEHLAALIAGRRATPQSAETREKISQALCGIKRSDETCKKISRAKQGQKYGPPTESKRRKIGEANKGERNGMAKLTMALAQEIRERYATNDVSLSQLGREYGVDTKQIHRIVRNESWRE